MSTIRKAAGIWREDGLKELLSRSPKWAKKRVRRFRGIARGHVYSVSAKEPTLTMDTPEGTITFEADPKWFQFPGIKSGEIYEPLLLQALGDSLSEEDVFYNVGARYGIFSLFARKCGLHDRNIHSFEAESKNIEILRNNLGSEMPIVEGFVSDTNEGSNVMLDKYAHANKEPTVIKIDVEGAEMRALSGANSLLSRKKPELFIEVHKSIENLGDSQAGLVDYLRDKGYSLKLVDHRSAGAKLEPVQNGKLPDTDTFLIRAR